MIYFGIKKSGKVIAIGTLNVNSNFIPNAFNFVHKILNEYNKDFLYKDSNDRGIIAQLLVDGYFSYAGGTKFICSSEETKRELKSNYPSFKCKRFNSKAIFYLSIIDKEIDDMMQDKYGIIIDLDNNTISHNLFTKCKLSETKDLSYKMEAIEFKLDDFNLTDTKEVEELASRNINKYVISMNLKKRLKKVYFIPSHVH